MDELDLLAAATAAKKKKGKPDADMSLLGRIKDNVIGVDDGVMSTGERVGSLLNKGGESMTLGLVGDEASAAAADLIPGGMDYNERLEFERRNERQIERENPYLTMGAEIGGGVLGAFLPGGAIGQMTRGGLGVRALASAAAGGGMGGIYGFMEGEGRDRAKSAQEGAAWGAGAGAIAPVAAAGVKRIADTLMQIKPRREALQAARSAADLRAGSRGQYSAFRDADAQITPEALSRLRSNVARGIDDMGAPKIPGPLGQKPRAGRDINRTLQMMDEQVQAANIPANTMPMDPRNPKFTNQTPTNPAVPLVAIEDVRKASGRLAREVDQIGRPTHGAAIASRAVREIDDFMDNLTPADVPVGDYEAAVSALKKAKELWKSSIKTQILENASDEADNYLSGTASGLRNQVKTLLRRNKKTKLFSKAEEDALRKVIGNNAIGRSVRLLGDGLGRKMATLGGGATGGLAGAAIGSAASEAASRIGDTMAERQMEIVKALISQGRLQSLPQMPNAQRNLIETLLRRGGVAAGQ